MWHDILIGVFVLFFIIGAIAAPRRPVARTRRITRRSTYIYGPPDDEFRR